MKIAVNKRYGGFGVSKDVFKLLNKEWDGYGYLSNEDFNIKDDNYYAYRTNQDLIKAIEKAGNKASGELAEVVIIEIPDGIEYEINDYDGIETVHEIHRSW